ncbi:MAG: DUF721 domain-containing protein [Bacteroidetes bacterium]|nr:DUF721 domain-containing protein [Bacteroidota bacterium]
MKEEKSIKDLLSNVFKSYNQGYKYEETSVINSWEQIVGNMIAPCCSMGNNYAIKAPFIKLRKKIAWCYSILIT